MLMNKIGASCGPFNCVKVHWSAHTIVNVTKKTLETTLAVLCWIVKTAPSSLAVKRKFVRWEPQESQFFATNWATPLRNRSNRLCGTSEGKRGSIWREKAWKFAFPPFFNYSATFYYEGSSKRRSVLFDRCVASESWTTRKCLQRRVQDLHRPTRSIRNCSVLKRLWFIVVLRRATVVSVAESGGL